jgi:hypothetical protein
MRYSLALLAAAAAMLLGAAPASAWTASGSYGSVYIDGLAGETHNVTIEGIEGAATAGYKTADSVVIRDASATITSVGQNCIKLDAHDMRCTSAFGAQRVFLDYTAGTGGDKVDVPVASAPFSFDAKTGPGADRVTVYGPAGVTAALGLGADSIVVSITGTTPLTPPGGTIDGGYGNDDMRIADHRRETPVCGPDFDYLQADLGEHNDDCDTYLESPVPN